MINHTLNITFNISHIFTCHWYPKILQLKSQIYDILFLGLCIFTNKYIPTLLYVSYLCL